MSQPDTELVAGYDVRPDLVEEQDRFRVFNSQVEATIAQNPAEGFTMRTATGRLTLRPLGAQSTTAAGTNPVRDASVVTAGLEPGVDTLLRPTANGMDI